MLTIRVKNSIRNLVGLFLLLILIFNTPFFGVQLVKYLYMISFIYFFLGKKKFSPEQNKLLLLGIFLVLYGFSYTFIRGVGDLNMFGFSRLFTSLFSSVLIIDLLRNKKEDTTGLLKWLSVCAILQAVIVLTGFVSPSFKTFIISLCGGTPRYSEKLETLAQIRGIGWTFSQFSDFAIAEGLSFLAFIGLCAYTRLSLKKSLPIRDYLTLFLCIFSGILIGRTFQIIIMVGFLYYCVCVYKKSGFHSIKEDIWRLILVGILVIGSLVLLLWDQIPTETIEWAFEAYTNFSESRKFETASTDELQTMWILPSNFVDVLLGTGRFENPDPTGHPTFSHSDVGFVNSIYYWGVIGSIIYYFCIYLSFRYAAVTAEKPFLKYLSYSMLLVIFIYNMKGLGNGFSYACLLLQWNISARSAKDRLKYCL